MRRCSSSPILPGPPSRPGRSRAASRSRSSASRGSERMSPDRLREELYRERVLVIHRGKDRETVLRKARAVRDGGLLIQEITWTTPDAGGIIRELTKAKIGVIGAGSVLDLKTARAAFAAGASFLVS